MSEIIEPQEISVMSLNGEGTQENPYQITTVAEFRAMNDSTAYFKLMNDLDVNGSEWASNWTQATVEFLEFDGDGYEIRNIIMSDMESSSTKNGVLSTKGSNSDRLITIKNTKFINVVMQGVSGSFFGYAGSNTYTSVDFIRCDFAISCSLSGTAPVMAHIRLFAKLDQCTITISGICGLIYSTDSVSDARAITNCAWVIDANIGLTRSSDCVFKGVFIKNSVRGKINFSKSYSNVFSHAESQCYMACEIQSLSPTVNFSTYAPSTACFYDQELAGITMTAQTNVHALTTAQCKDKDYLNSIGFVVV